MREYNTCTNPNKHPPPLYSIYCTNIQYNSPLLSSNFSLLELTIKTQPFICILFLHVNNPICNQANFSHVDVNPEMSGQRGV